MALLTRNGIVMPCACREANNCTCGSNSSCYSGLWQFKTDSPRCYCVATEDYSCQCLATITKAEEATWTTVESEPFIPDPEPVLDTTTLELLETVEHSHELKETPRHYQLEDIDWLTSEPNVGDKRARMLMHPAGLGKTLILIEAAQRITAPSSTILVVCPGYTVPQWYDYFTKQYPNVSVCDIRGGSKQQKLAYLNHHPLDNPTLDPADHNNVRRQSWRVLIVNYELTRGADYLPILRDVLPIETVVLDESQNVKNRTSQQSQAIESITHSNRHVKNIFMASATPIMREAGDLYQQLHILSPYEFENYNSFLTRYCTYDVSSYGAQNVRLRKQVRVFVEEPASPPPPLPALPPSPPQWASDVDTRNEQLAAYERTLYQERVKLLGYKRELEESKHPRRTTQVVDVMSPQALGKFMMGRSYDEVGLELPDLIESKRIVDLEPERRKQYDEFKSLWRTKLAESPDLFVSATNQMAAMHTLRMMASGQAKVQACIETILETPGPHLVYTAYEASAANAIYDLLIKQCPELAPTTCLITGAKSKEERAEQAVNPAYSLVIATMKSIGAGLNLQRFRTVIFFQGEWTPGFMYQCLTRVHRARKDDDPDKSPVLAYYLLSSKTIDETIHQRRNNRSNNARDILKIELSRV